MTLPQRVYMSCPLGTVAITGDETGISAITCLDEPLPSPTETEVPSPLQAGLEQLRGYFAGIRQTFNLKLNPSGTAFQQQVWLALLDVPYGQTLSYLALSRRLGDEKAIRAVAAANGKNPLWIVVPCHRIIGSNGELTGYAGGLWRKKWLLEHEQGTSQLRISF